MIECDDNKIKEKNINFIATRDNKVLFSKFLSLFKLLAFRFNLYEDEIK